MVYRSLCTTKIPKWKYLQFIIQFHETASVQYIHKLEPKPIRFNDLLKNVAEKVSVSVSFHCFQWILKADVYKIVSALNLACTRQRVHTPDKSVYISQYTGNFNHCQWQHFCAGTITGNDAFFGRKLVYQTGRKEQPQYKLQATETRSMSEPVVS